MSGRRPRLVIKPNIRPGVGKTTPVSKPKPTQSSPVSEITIAIKTHQAPTGAIDKSVTSKEDDNRDENVKFSVCAEGTSSCETTEGDKVIIIEPCNKSLQPEIETDVQVIRRKELSIPRTHGDEDVTQHSVAPSGSHSSFKTPKSPLSHQAASSETEAHSFSTRRIDDTQYLKKPEDVSEAEGRKPDQPMEIDDSEASVASSLEPDCERQTEVEEASGKKPRRHRSRKPKLEALPSRDKSPDRQKMKMSDLLLWNPERNFLPTKPKTKKNVKDENKPTSPDESLSVEDKADATKEAENAALPAPQVMIGPDGNVVLNTESLLISTPEKGSHTRSKIIVEEDDDDRYLNTNSYRKSYKKKLWSEEETDKFFIGLSMCGTDFSLLTKLLTNRSRRELKNKFRREEKFNRPRVDKSLSNMRHYDPSVFVEKPPLPSKPKVKKHTSLTKKEKEARGIPISKTPESAIKSSKTPAKKEKLPPKKKAKKRKSQESSEDEEDDWGPEYDEIDEEEEMAARLPAYNKRPQRKVSTVGAGTKHAKPGEEEEDQTWQMSQSSVSIVPIIPNPDSVSNESHSARGRAASPKAFSFATKAGGNSQMPKPSTGIQPIPGTTQVQIEVSGVQTPVQGMLIPSHMVPALAPQLGLGEGALGGRAQVLLVHEESADGSLVHVYIIPEDGSAAGASSTSQVNNNSKNLSGGHKQSQHPLQHLGASKALHHGGNALSSSVDHSNVPGSTLPFSPLQQASGHQISSNASHPGNSVSSRSPFPPTSPANMRPQPQFSSSTSVRAFSPFPPNTGVKPPSPFPPVTGIKSPTPFPPTMCTSLPNLPTFGGKSPTSFPPTSRASSTSLFPPTSGNPSPAGVRSQSPFPPLLSGKKNLLLSGITNSTHGSTCAADATLFPKSPPPIQGQRSQLMMPRPQPQTKNAPSLMQKNSSETITTVVTDAMIHSSSHATSSKPPIQNLMAAVKEAESCSKVDSIATDPSQPHAIKTDFSQQSLPTNMRTSVSKNLLSETDVEKNPDENVSTGRGNSLAVALSDAEEALLVPDRVEEENHDFIAVAHVVENNSQTLEHQQKQEQ